MVHLLNLKRPHFIEALLLITLTATFSSAQQPVRSVQTLQSTLTTDDELRVIDRNGKTSTGRFISISGSSLTLLVRGTRQEFSEATIREIRQRRAHGGQNVLLGAAIGGVAGGVTAAAVHPGADNANSGTTSIGVMIGAGIGASIVALKHLFTRRYETVFMASGTPVP